MDWARAIEINHAALTRIVATLFAMVEVARDSARLSRPLYRLVSRVLCPAESALRRLIVIAARGLVVKPAPVRPMPQGLAFAGSGGGRISFQLFDQRKRFGRVGSVNSAAKAMPRIHVFSAGPLIPLFQSRPIETPAAVPDATIDATRLNRRLAAIKAALDDLPRQARRMARWQARRDRIQGPKFRSPFRPGSPPGYRKEPVDEIDWVLRECHGLASDALNQDTS